MDDEFPPEALSRHEKQGSEPEAEKTGRRVLRRRILIGVAFILSVPALVYFARIWAPKIWGDLHVVNFIVAAIPTILSILFAFIIDKDLGRRMRYGWRLSIIGVGMLYSLFLWHQLDLTDRANAKQTQDAIGSAVQQANAHSDQKFREIQGKVDGLGNSLNQTATEIGKQLNQTEVDLDSNIGKVGKPAPPAAAKLVFSLWSDSATFENPLMHAFLCEGTCRV
jgi:hypothetical protein